MNITVFCGSNIGKNDDFIQAAKNLAKLIASNGNLIYGGNKSGLMGLLASEVKKNGGKVVGIMPKFLLEKEIPNTDINQFILVEDIDIRKKKMIDMADICIALPGGVGTLEEISQAFSWSRIGLNDSSLILMNVSEYYTPLKKMFENMVQNGFLSESDLNKILITDDIKKIEELIKEK
ncbi:MAG: TIGR00730 family Rossman fold protein [Tissierellia bacterium]|nr:TIGR00730 family Rossman fold protein [Tissierellia bacterium]